MGNNIGIDLGTTNRVVAVMEGCLRNTSDAAEDPRRVHIRGSAIKKITQPRISTHSSP